MRIRVFLISLVIALTNIDGLCVNAQSPTTTVARIEQDWKVELYSTGDDANNSPQLVSAFKLPNSTITFQITWNHIDTPSYSAGGFQLQAWDGDVLMDSHTTRVPSLSATNEVLTWTQVVTTTSPSQEATGHAFQAKNIASSSWGSDEADDDVATVGLGQSANLNNYTAAACLEDSAVVVGTNRVKWYGIVETRFYDQKGELISRDTLPKTVFQQVQYFSYYHLKRLDWTGAVRLDSDTASVTLDPTGTELMIQ